MILLRVLWGKQIGIARWARMWKLDTCTHIGIDLKGIPQHILVCGKDNADLLVKNKFENVTLVDDDPWFGNFYDHRDRRVPGGIVRPWSNKWKMIKLAVQEYNDVVYCDWNVHVIHKDWPFIESKLTDKDLHLCAFRYGKSRYPNRPFPSNRIVPSGSWVHVRGTEFVDRVLSRMTYPYNRRSWHDEYVMGDLLDEQHGGWMGDATWLERYEQPLRVLGGRRSPWGPISTQGFEIRRRTPVPFTWYKVFV